MSKMFRGWVYRMRFGLLAGALLGLALTSSAQEAASLRNEQLSVTVRSQDGSYEIRAQGSERPVVQARVGAKLSHRWLSSSAYPHHRTAESTFEDPLGHGHQVTITFTGLSAKPDLICILRLYDRLPFGDVEVRVENHTAKVVTVQAIRSVEAIGEPRIDLNGRESADRILSDSFSEDWPTLSIYDLGQAPKGMHRGWGSQLIYNRESEQSLFLGALSSQRFLTILRLQVQDASSGEPKIASYTVDSTGTTEIQATESDYLRDAPAENRIEISLPVAPGKELASERMMFAAGRDYHAQLDAYGEAIRLLHHARVSENNLIGWWSWTAFYSGISQGTALTNAHWLAQHLKAFGYDYFHIDEGYQYARGEYTTPNAAQFPDGMRRLSHEICRLGLKFGLWTAPFEVTDRASVYERHKEWLVHNARGKPIQVGVVGHSGPDRLYGLDTTHPGAQEYLRQTYKTLAREWGVRYIKLDFMDTTAIEGYHYRPNTTALEAQRIGLEIIRKAVGEDVLLDKDGSPMLNAVGIVDEGRVSVDTGHSFQASKEAVPGIAARYYMHRNFFINDPDSFTVSRQLIPDHDWHQSKTPLTLNEAQVSITLSAVSGGMYEIGDDLPTLGADPDRLALVENRELLAMAQLGRAAVPLDLMNYRPEDALPSVFFLREDSRQAMLAVFNWTEEPRSRAFQLSDLKLPAEHAYQAYDALDEDKPVALDGVALRLENQPAHSVRLIKIVDTSVTAAPPSVTAEVPTAAGVGQPLKFSAANAGEVPSLSYHWDFDDGTVADGAEVTHTYTKSANYTVQLTVEGMDGIATQKRFSITVSGDIRTRFNLLQNRRYVEPSDQ